MESSGHATQELELEHDDEPEEHDGHDAGDNNHPVKGMVSNRNGSTALYTTVSGHPPDRRLTWQKFWIRCLLWSNGLLLILAISLILVLVHQNKRLEEEENEIEQLKDSAASSSEAGGSQSDGSDPGSSSSTATNDSGNNSSSASSLAGLVSWAPLPDPNATLTRIAFGSCSSQHMPFPYWDTLATIYQPELLLFMGDNVYGDCVNTTTDDDPCLPLRAAYIDFANHPSVQGGLRQIPVFATLDDHDYGMGDANQFNPFKDLARDYFAAFYNLSTVSTADTDAATAPQEDLVVIENNDDQGQPPLPNDGVYRAKVWGNAATGIVQVILLDTRYGRSPFASTGDSTAPYNGTTDTENSQMLSEQQWTWLEQQLSTVPADLRLIVSSIQVLNDVTAFECWRHIPAERERLYELLLGTMKNDSTASGDDGGGGAPIVLLSGDRHVGGFYSTPEGLMEVTASSWTHTIPFGAYGSNCTTAATCDEVDPRRDGDLVRVNHFGTVDIDWEQRTARLAIRRAESSYGVPYILVDELARFQKSSDAGEVLQEKTILF